MIPNLSGPSPYRVLICWEINRCPQAYTIWIFGMIDQGQTGRRATCSEMVTWGLSWAWAQARLVGGKWRKQEDELTRRFGFKLGFFSDRCYL